MIKSNLSKDAIRGESFAPQVNLSVPNEEIYNYPEKVLQFGTGVLLRGLCDYFIDKANKQGVFIGRIVIVKSTDKGDSSEFQNQNGLFTHCIKGVENGEIIEEFIVNASVSRTLSASKEWNAILDCAQNPEMQVIISNTTEVGIQLVADDLISGNPPKSFPVKLLAFLHHRWKHFNGSPESGMVIIPTELIIDNGDTLQEIVLEQAHRNGLEPEFIDWIDKHNHFCNSLVDRIVPGKPDEQITQKTLDLLGYQDKLLIMSESYSLWAIQGDDFVKEKLSFAQVNPGVVITPNIDSYRELKLRLLNGTHTLMCGMAYLLGFRLVKDVMANGYLGRLVTNLMLGELALAIPYKMDSKTADRFGRSVLDRFRNPFINHKLIDITVQYTTKMRMRNVPILFQYYREFGKAPELFAMGFAAYLQFMHVVKVENGKFYGESNGEYYPINCDFANYFHEAWKTGELDLKKVLSDKTLWGEDLNQLAGFNEAISKYI
ncbi:tagaturonate reductase [Pseudarcicella hirudinis]|uniref:Tagaturonate reductase n=1 Tax=Pseudarcicella hirudinis TaxID=1079859 RepID=A0A1I5WKB6_9BACT|nr:tagaturonate reductase [Pseudarcicella hirudinis]SFQ20017.1 tagaturonate reductase [Pseudarcicella hirudinis]